MILPIELFGFQPNFFYDFVVLVFSFKCYKLSFMKYIENKYRSKKQTIHNSQKINKNRISYNFKNTLPNSSLFPDRTFWFSAFEFIFYNRRWWNVKRIELEKRHYNRC